MNPPVLTIRRQWILLSVACLLQLAQTLPLLHTRWVEDESWQSIPAYSLLTEGRIRNPTFAETDEEFAACVKPPGHTLVLALMFKLAGVGVVPARIPSLLVAIGVTILTFLLGRRLLSPAAGIVAAFLVATDNFLFLAARTARPEAFVTFLNLLGLLWYFQSREQKNSFLRALGSGLAVGSSMLFHPNGMVAMLSIGVLFLTEGVGRVWRQSRPYGFALGVAVMILPFWCWAHSTPIHAQAFATTYSRAEYMPLADKLAKELPRYEDFLGMANTRFKLYAMAIPWRAHVAALIVISLGVLWLKNRPLFTLFSVVLVTQEILWLYLINPTVRYFAVLAPVFALVVASAVCLPGWRRGWRRAWVAAAVVLGLSMAAGNLLFLYKFRHANYTALQRQLRQQIPKGQSVYGAITFWPALYDRTYYCYDRMSFDYAIHKRQPSYFILNDRVMVKGMGRDEDDWAALRSTANAFARTHGQLVSHVADSFYGDLDIYHIHYDP